MGISRECRICFGRCDPGELRDGVCFECTMELKRRKKNKNQMENMVKATEYRQIEMEEYIDGYKQNS